MTARLLRLAGITIAIAAAIDPAVNSMRRTPATIALVAGEDVTSAAMADRVARELSSDFTIVRGPFAGAAAVVSVGDRLPAAAETLPAATPAFAVTSADDTPAIRLTALRAPARATLESKVPIEARVRVERQRGRTLEVTLKNGGVAVDRIAQQITADAETLTIPLTFVPTAEGPAVLSVSATASDSSLSATADVLVDVSRSQWAVLVFDRRPSWTSTFVRRALERDPRFVVTSRVITSRDLSSDTGRPPGTLDDLPSLSLFDAVVVGVPEELTERDVNGLEAFLRRRGGAVCMLFDQRDQRVTSPYEHLLGPITWSAGSATTPASVERAGANPLRLLATEFSWPSTPPAGSQPVASSLAGAGNTSSLRPVLWSLPVGSGRLVVNGALDAWRYRDASSASFDRFWQSVVADAASMSPPLVDVSVDRPLLAPHESTDVTIVLRDESLADLSGVRTLRASVHVALEMPSGNIAVRAWPAGAPGTFRATVHAPDEAGTYRLVVNGNGARVETPIVVQPKVARALPDDRDLVAAWTASHHGITVPAPRSREVGQALARSLPAPSEDIRWHPMRSAWWIVPFALVLGGEWWMRRRRGLM